MKKYILDLTHCPVLPPLFQIKGSPLLILCRKGQFECDYDVLEKELPPGIYEKWRKHLKVSIRYKGKSLEEKKQIDSKPIGFKIHTLPKGAVIREWKPRTIFDKEEENEG